MNPVRIGNKILLHQRCVVGDDHREEDRSAAEGRANSELMRLENTILISPSLGLFPHLFERKSSRSSTMLRFYFFEL